MDLLANLVAELDKALDEDSFPEVVADILRNNLQIQDDVEVCTRLPTVGGLRSSLHYLGLDARGLHHDQRTVAEDKKVEYFVDEVDLPGMG